MRWVNPPKKGDYGPNALEVELLCQVVLAAAEFAEQHEITLKCLRDDDRGGFDVAQELQQVKLRALAASLKATT